MLRHNRLKIRLLPPTLDRSLIPTAVNIEIRYKDKLFIAVKAIKKSKYLRRC